MSRYVVVARRPNGEVVVSKNTYENRADAEAVLAKAPSSLTDVSIQVLGDPKHLATALDLVKKRHPEREQKR